MTQVNKNARLPGIRKHISSFRPTCERQTLPFRLLVGIGTLVSTFVSDHQGHDESAKGPARRCGSAHYGAPTIINFLQDALDIIISDLDIRSLEAVSTTYHSWYLAVAPYLHHALTLGGPPLDWARMDLKRKIA